LIRGSQVSNEFKSRRVKKKHNIVPKETLGVTFREIIPGMIHDFASPLNGILGRSELLEARARKHLELLKKDTNNIDDEILAGCKKISDDAGLIAKELERFFGLFNDVAGKYQRLFDIDLQTIDLSELIEAKIAFLQFNPDCKVNIKKHLVLDRKIPGVPGIKADYSISLSAIIRHSLNSMKDSEVKEFVVSTGHDDSCVCIEIEDTGTPIVGIKGRSESLNSTDQFLCDLDDENELFDALSLLEKNGAFFQMTRTSGVNIISIRIPFLHLSY
jgi:hypothetical protein